MLREYLTNIANAIRVKLGTTDTINAQDFSTKVDEVYEQGRKDEYDEFWDAFQNKGKRVWYARAFQQCTRAAFKPKYDFIFTNNRSDLQVSGLFMNCYITGSFNEMLEEEGIIMDFSKVTTFEEVFSGCMFSEITIYAPNAKNGYGSFGWALQLKTLNVTLNDSFAGSEYLSGLEKLENLTLGHKITASNVKLSSSKKLTEESIVNVINALSEDTSGLTVTLSKTAVNNAFGINIDDPTTWAEGTEYYELRHSRDNWTITYV